jgi:hypothetical protein
VPPSATTALSQMIDCPDLCPTVYTRAANCGIYAKQIGNIPNKTGWQLTCFANFSALGPWQRTSNANGYSRSKFLMDRGKMFEL